MATFSANFSGGSGGVTHISGTVKAERFHATTDGTDASKAFGWDADPNLGLQREGADTLSIGVQANEPLRVTQFEVVVGEALTHGGNRTNTTISPTSLGTTPQNDYAPASWSGNVGAIRQAASVAITFNGLAALGAGARVFWHNISANNHIFAHENAGSAATNRFTCPGSVNYTLGPNDSVILEYDGTSTRWRIVG